MLIKLFMLKIFHNVKQSVLSLLILAIVTAFLVMSLNLYHNGCQNLEQAEDTYSTIAIVELYGDVNRCGELTPPGSNDHKGYLSVAVDGYDIDEIVNVRGVIGYDLRAKYAAYIEGEPAMQHDPSGEVDNIVMASEDIIRFTVEGDVPITIPISWSKDYKGYNEMIYLNISETAAGCYWYKKNSFNCDGIVIGFTEAERSYYAEQVRKLNRNEEVDYVTLYPGVEYIAGTWMTSGWHTTEDSKGLLVGIRRFHPSRMDYFSENFYVNYGKKESVDAAEGMDADQPFPIARWDDVQNDPVLKEQWAGAWKAMKYNTCSYTVCLTDDITGVPVFHLGGAFLADGRMITEEEYAAGGKVCMISKEMARLQNWRVGDKLDMDFFQFEAFPNNNTTEWDSQPVYHKNTEGFFDSGEYEIIGIFDQKTLVGNSGIAASTLTMAWNTIYIPHNAVQNTLPEEKLPVHGALLTIWLENGSINDFLADMDALGLTVAKDGQYNPTFTFYDQGYSVIQPSLQGMYSTAKLLLILSVLLLVITCVLLSYFFAQNQKHNIGIFRMLGGKKAQVLLAVFICSALIAVIAAMPGTIIGHILSERVGETMLTSDFEENEKTAALRAYVLETEETDTSAFEVHSDFKLSLLAGSTALLFPILSLAFVVIYVGREPRELLPKNKA